MVFKGPATIINAGNMSGDIISTPLILQQLYAVSFAIAWSGTSPSGTMVVQVSNDYSENVNGSVRNAGVWTDLPLSSTPTVSGNSDSGFIDVELSSAYAIRLKYSRASGSGSMTAVAMGK